MCGCERVSASFRHRTEAQGGGGGALAAPPAPRPSWGGGEQGGVCLSACATSHGGGTAEQQVKGEGAQRARKHGQRSPLLQLPPGPCASLAAGGQGRWAHAALAPPPTAARPHLAQAWRRAGEEGGQHGRGGQLALRPVLRSLALAERVALPHSQRRPSLTPLLQPPRPRRPCCGCRSRQGGLWLLLLLLLLWWQLQWGRLRRDAGLE